MEDIALHVKRQVFEPPKNQAFFSNTDDESGGLNPLSAAWEAPNDVDRRPRLVVLGSGWAAHALIKVIDTEKFRVLVVRWASSSFEKGQAQPLLPT